MALARWQGGVIELHPGAGEDPDGSRTAAIITAYIEAEHAHVFRRLLWRRLSIIGLIAGTVEVAMRVVSGSSFAIFCVILGFTALVAPVVEWRADRKLTQLLSQQDRCGSQIIS
jgi:hypothetical protein